MILANVIFGAEPKSSKQQLEDIAHSYISDLYKSGQLCGEYFITWIRGALNAHVLLAGPNAFALRHHSKYGKKELERVAEAFGRRPVWRMIDDEAAVRQESWTRAPFLYLFTHAFDWASPVCRGDGKPPIPVYRLPIAFTTKEQLYFWQRSCSLHDSMFLQSGALEMAAYRELADPRSELAQEGRDLCRDLEARTGLPTFYYLERYWARAKGEDRRRCPGCGGAWNVPRAVEKPGAFWQFEFRCDPCRLVSHQGVSTDGGRHSRIGEFESHKRKRNQKHKTVRSG